MNIRLKYNWRQHTPAAQLVVTRMGLEGSYDNFQEESLARISTDRAIDPRRFFSSMNNYLEQLDDLQPHINAGKWLCEDPFVETVVDVPFDDVINPFGG